MSSPPTSETSEMDGPPSITDGLRNRRYPETPMPDNFDVEDDYNIPRHEEPEEDEEPNKWLENIMYLVVLSITIAHFWTVWTLQTDVNILMQYQTEHIAQYQHIGKLLESMHQVKWQMVPALTN